MTGALVMDDRGQVRFRETTANGTSYVALQAAASVASNKTITLPDATGTVVLSGAIVNADINASAAIVDTKLDTIATAGKVADSALPDTISSNITGNAATATNLSSVRTFELTGDVTGSVSSNLSSGMSISATVAAGALLVSAGAVGSYQLCKNQSGGTINAGATVAGSSLKQGYGSDGGGWFGSEPSPSGTWRHMGSRNIAFTQHGLFQRIS